MQYSNLILLSDSEVDRLQSEQCYDLAIIGAGVSSAYTLIHYILLLEQQHSVAGDTTETSKLPTQPVKIIVTEKSGEFWAGIPYGDRSGRNALLISSLKEFMPHQEERSHFINWLITNREWVFDQQEQDRGELSSKWLQANEAAMSEGLWDDLFIPRHTFGLYLNQRISTVLESAISKGLIECDLVTADVVDIQHFSVATTLRNQDLYRVDFVAAQQNCHFVTKKLVLAIGSPPNIAFEQANSDDVMTKICYIDNIYEPSLDSNIERIFQSLEHQSDRQVLIVGSNAGTLDTLYSINNSKLASSHPIDKFIILSPTGTFPHRISREVVQITYTPQSLLDLVQSKSFTAKQILEAVAKDVADATAQSINISDIYAEISKVVMQALNLLNLVEQKQFVDRYAVEIGKLQRRAGGEYLDVVDHLISQHKLEFVKGRFVSHFPINNSDGWGCEYIDSGDCQHKVLDAPIGVIINCAGFQDVTKSSSVLIQNLIRREICIPNDSSRGFIIDKNFETNSKNCYLMGPLVAGNIDGSLRVWHAESCQRIFSLSKQLADVLIQSDRAEISPIVAVPAVDPINVLVNAA